MKRLENKHPLAIRWFHWISFPLLSVMMWSGLLIYWANDVYRVGWGSTTLIHFFPQSLYDAFHIGQRLAEGMALHFLIMWLFVLNGIAYVFYLAISGQWRELVPNKTALRDAIQVTLHDLGLRKTLPPQGKYNGAQRIAYTSVVAMGIGSTITGLAIYKPAQLAWLVTLLGGYQMARWEHFCLMIAFAGFFVVHIIQVIRAGWDNLRSMIAGRTLVSVESNHEQ